MPVERAFSLESAARRARWRSRGWAAAMRNGGDVLPSAVSTMTLSGNGDGVAGWTMRRGLPAMAFR